MHTLGPGRDSRSRCHPTRPGFADWGRPRGGGLPRRRAGGPGRVPGYALARRSPAGPIRSPQHIAAQPSVNVPSTPVSDAFVAAANRTLARQADGEPMRSWAGRLLDAPWVGPRAADKFRDAVSRQVRLVLTSSVRARLSRYRSRVTRYTGNAIDTPM